MKNKKPQAERKEKMKAKEIKEMGSLENGDWRGCGATNLLSREPKEFSA